MKCKYLSFISRPVAACCLLAFYLLNCLFSFDQYPLIDTYPWSYVRLLIGSLNTAISTSCCCNGKSTSAANCLQCINLVSCPAMLQRDSSVAWILNIVLCFQSQLSRTSARSFAVVFVEQYLRSPPSDFPAGRLLASSIVCGLCGMCGASIPISTGCQVLPTVYSG